MQGFRSIAYKVQIYEREVGLFPSPLFYIQVVKYLKRTSHIGSPQKDLPWKRMPWKFISLLLWNMKFLRVKQLEEIWLNVYLLVMKQNTTHCRKSIWKLITKSLAHCRGRILIFSWMTFCMFLFNEKTSIK